MQKARIRLTAMETHKLDEVCSQVKKIAERTGVDIAGPIPCLLYTSDAADDLLCVDLGGRRIITKNNSPSTHVH